MKGILIGAAGAVGIGAAIAATAATLGWIDVAADEPHAPAVYRLIEFVRERSIERRSGGIVPPADLGSPERVRRGAGNYDAMCADCHLAPGTDDSEIRRGLYPRPPKLSQAAPGALPPTQAAARRFWIIKHGIKATGMPAWGKGGMDAADIWDLTAFVGVLPRLSAQQYRQQVAASEGHAHGGVGQAHPSAAKGDEHRHDAKPQGHERERGAHKH